MARYRAQTPLKLTSAPREEISRACRGRLRINRLFAFPWESLLESSEETPCHFALPENIHTYLMDIAGWKSLLVPGEAEEAHQGLNHGVGHPLLLLYDAKAHRGKNSNYFQWFRE